MDRHVSLLLRETSSWVSHTNFHFWNNCNFFSSSEMFIRCTCYGSLVKDSDMGWSLEHLNIAKLVLYTPVTICESTLCIKDYRWHFYIFQVMQIISLSDASCISKLVFLSEVQTSLTELLLFASDQEPWVTEIWSLNNKLYSGYPSGVECCIISNVKHIHICFTYRYPNKKESV